MCITSGGKSHDATAVKLWYEVYFLDKTEDLTGGHGTPVMVSACIKPTCSWEWRLLRQ